MKSTPSEKPRAQARWGHSGERSRELLSTELTNRFLIVANRILVDHDTSVDKVVGDQVIGIFIPATAAMGDTVNTTARLSSVAAGGASTRGYGGH